MKKKKINVRAKGHAFERKIAQELRDLGFTKCKTSRLESKMLDDMKVDLTHTGDFNIQCKAVERGIYPHDIISEMPDDDKMNLLFHKRNRKGEVVSMDKDDFYKLLNIYNEYHKTNTGGRSRTKDNKSKPISRR